MKIGAKIQKMRQFKGIKQESVANMLGLSQAAYSKIERSETEMDSDKLKQIANALGCDPTEILNIDENHLIVNTFNNHSESNTNFIQNQYQSDKNITYYEDLLEFYKKEINLLKEEIKRLKS
jgi:transcriptional regulator with XRE-family HTH domain